MRWLWLGSGACCLKAPQGKREQYRFDVRLCAYPRVSTCLYIHACCMLSASELIVFAGGCTTHSRVLLPVLRSYLCLQLVRWREVRNSSVHQGKTVAWLALRAFFSEGREGCGPFWQGSGRTGSSCCWSVGNEALPRPVWVCLLAVFAPASCRRYAWNVVGSQLERDAAICHPRVRVRSAEGVGLLWCCHMQYTLFRGVLWPSPVSWSLCKPKSVLFVLAWKRLTSKTAAPLLHYVGQCIPQTAHAIGAM